MGSERKGKGYTGISKSELRAHVNRKDRRKRGERREGERGVKG